MQETEVNAPDDSGEGEVARWITEIQLYDKESQVWVEKSKKIIKRYKDERNSGDLSKSKYNILWSNIQTLKPALYAKNPRPDIARRFKDNDDLSRVASDVLERATTYFVNETQFGQTMEQAVLDRLLCGRGTSWVRYVPHMRDMEVAGGEEVKDEGSQLTDDVYAESDDATKAQEVYFEEVCPDYVHWEDFGHTVARTWEEVRGVWRRVFLTRDELHERFDDTIGKEAVDQIPLDYSPKNLSGEKIPDEMKKAVVYEIWDKPSKKAKWLHKSYPKSLLDEQDDPLKLKEFFPCPQPLFATLANDSIIPVPDYVQYQDQARELDELTGRIISLTKALRVAGVYDASAQGIERLLAEGTENKLIPVENWAVLSEKGGIEKSIGWFPIEQVAKALLALYDAREKTKNDLYEITGLSDILRGASVASETATAQQIKGNFATMRLNSMQQDVARFARDLVRIIAEIIANHFQLDTIKQISGVKLFTAQEKQMIQQKMQLAQQMGQQVPPPDEQMEEMLLNPTWEEVVSMYKNDPVLHFRIDIETDSTIKADEEAEKQSRVEFLQAAGGFLKEAIEAGTQKPEMMPLLGQMMLFGIRGFKVGKELESAFEVMLNKLQKEADNPQQKPDPEMMKIQAQQQADAAKLQAEQQNKQIEMQVDQQRNQMEAEREQMRLAHEVELEKTKAAMQMQIEQAKLQTEAQLEQWKAKLDAETKVVVAEIQAKSSLQTAKISAKATVNDDNPDGEVTAEMEPTTTLADLLNTVTENMNNALSGVANTIADSHQQLVLALNKPKQVVRGLDGRISGVQ